MPNCGKLGTKYPFYIQDWRINPLIRFDVNNGVILCTECLRKCKANRLVFQSVLRQAIAETPAEDAVAIEAMEELVQPNPSALADLQAFCNRVNLRL